MGVNGIDCLNWLKNNNLKQDKKSKDNKHAYFKCKGNPLRLNKGKYIKVHRIVWFQSVFQQPLPLEQVVEVGKIQNFLPVLLSE